MLKMIYGVMVAMLSMPTAFSQIREQKLTIINAEKSAYIPRSEKAITLFNIADSNFQNNNFTKAIEYYEMAIKEDSNFISAYDNLGVIFNEMNLPDSAEKYLLISYRKSKTDFNAIQNLAMIADRRGDNKKAFMYYNEMVLLKPENPEGYYGVAYSSFKMGNVDMALLYGLSAEEHYKKLSSPYIRDCYNLLLLAYYSKRNKTEAKRYFDLCKANGIDVMKEIGDWLKK